MNVATEYGAIDVSNTAKPTASSSWTGKGKLASAAIACLVLLAMIIYLSAGHFMPNSGAPLAQMALDASSSTVHTSNLENCALEGDESCDLKYGCFSYGEDIEAVMDIMTSRWDDFAEYVQSKTDLSLDDDDDCMLNKYADKYLVCTRSCEKIGYLVDSKQPNLCKNTFLDEMKTTLRPYRRACIASLLAHQFTASCQGKGSAASQAEIAAFTWWARNYGVSSSWTHTDCPYYI